jgi:hypothetical protein
VANTAELGAPILETVAVNGVENGLAPGAALRLTSAAASMRMMNQQATSVP